MKTLNVVEVVDGRVASVRSWRDTEERAAQAHFIELVEKQEIALHGESAGLDSYAVNELLDEGSYESPNGYHVALIYSLDF